MKLLPSSSYFHSESRAELQSSQQPLCPKLFLLVMCSERPCARRRNGARSWNCSGQAEIPTSVFMGLHRYLKRNFLFGAKLVRCFFSSYLNSSKERCQENNQHLLSNPAHLLC